VYRLTIVKAWNSEEIEAYASLVALGKPDFIEVKGNNGEVCNRLVCSTQSDC